MCKHVKNLCQCLHFEIFLAAFFFMSNISGAQVVGKMSISCPSNISTNQSADVDQQGFNVLDAGLAIGRLTTATIYLNSPLEGESLVPDGERTGLIYWDIPVSTKEEKWIVCHYANTHVRLAKKLPSEVKSCKIAYRSKGAMRFILGTTEVISIRCSP
jgi:hypothetical protein